MSTIAQDLWYLYVVVAANVVALFLPNDVLFIQSANLIQLVRFALDPYGLRRTAESINAYKFDVHFL